MENVMKKLVVAAIASALVLSSPFAAAQEKKEKVTVSWLPVMQTMAYYVAIDEKLFEKAGIEINSVKFQNPNQIIDSLVSGQADVGAPGTAAGITALAESRYPGSFKVFGLQGGGIKVDRINDGLIVSNNSTITSFKDLKGKSIGTLPGIQWKTITRYVLRQNGLDPDKDVRINEIAVPMHVPSVVAGTVDATLSLEPVGSIAIASKEAKRAMTNPVARYIADPFYSGVSVLSTKFIKERPAVAKKVVEVLDQATRMVNADFDKYRPVIAKYTAIQANQVQMVAQPYLRANNELNEADIKSYQALVDVFQKEGVLKERVDVHKIMLKPTDIK
jgi:NitT/TauT family transport system substrate-binding protein